MCCVKLLDRRIIFEIVQVIGAMGYAISYKYIRKTIVVKVSKQWTPTPISAGDT